jgi:hypothetical protein
MTTEGLSQKFNAVALHWLLGLVLLARGDEDAALAELERELEGEKSGHLYARECCANTERMQLAPCGCARERRLKRSRRLRRRLNECRTTDLC